MRRANGSPRTATRITSTCTGSRSGWPNRLPNICTSASAANWGLPPKRPRDPDTMLAQGHRSSLYSFDYPACSNLAVDVQSIACCTRPACIASVPAAEFFGLCRGEKRLGSGLAAESRPRGFQTRLRDPEIWSAVPEARIRSCRAIKRRRPPKRRATKFHRIVTRIASTCMCRPVREHPRRGQHRPARQFQRGCAASATRWSPVRSVAAGDA